jgi:cytochrome c oxidase assembly protein subunit 15
VVRLAIPQSLAILGQAVLGGITVRTGLNPWTVAAHLLLSVAIVYAAYALWVRTGEGDGPRVFAVARPLVWLARTLTAATAAVIVAGTVVTGSGPHSGAKAASRTGLDLGAVTQLHADLVFLLLGLTAAAWLAFRAAGYGERPVLVLLGVELAQGVLGFVQYALKLPIVAVELHVIGATILWIAALAVLFGVRTRA